MNVPRERFEDPESREIPVPETMEATCPTHGFIATVTLGTVLESDGPTWVVRCGYCDAPCTLEQAKRR